MIKPTIVVLTLLFATGSETVLKQTEGHWRATESDKEYGVIKKAVIQDLRILIDRDSLRFYREDEIGNEQPGLTIPIDSIETGPKGWKANWSALDSLVYDKTTVQRTSRFTLVFVNKNKAHAQVFTSYGQTYDSTGSGTGYFPRPLLVYMVFNRTNEK